MKNNKSHILGLKDFLDEKVSLYNQPGFIENDPISIPHSFRKRQDIEIAGLFAAVLSWGQRKTIIRKSHELLNLMDRAPHEFLLNYKKKDLDRFNEFVHRTFQFNDLLYFVKFLGAFYRDHDSLEDAFIVQDDRGSVEKGLVQFHNLFFSMHPLPRTQKHISTPARKSACKRLNMYLRWMVRKDHSGVDFGIWNRISAHQLICPCDVHVERVARKLKLIRSKNLNWQTAVELTDNLKMLDADDPVKYDFALFGLGLEGYF